MTVRNFIDEVVDRLKAVGLSPENTQFCVKIPGRRDGYCAGTWDLHPSPKYKPGPILIMNPHAPDQAAPDEGRQQSLVNARQAYRALMNYATGEDHILTLGDQQREGVASLLEEFDRLDAKERFQRAAGQFGERGKEYGKKGGRPAKKA